MLSAALGWKICLTGELFLFFLSCEVEQFLPRGTEKWKLDERFSRANQPRKQTLSNEVDVNLHREILSLLFRLIVSASCGTLVSFGCTAGRNWS